MYKNLNYEWSFFLLNWSKQTKKIIKLFEKYFF